MTRKRKSFLASLALMMSVNLGGCALIEGGVGYPPTFGPIGVHPIFYQGGNVWGVPPILEQYAQFLRKCTGPKSTLANALANDMDALRAAMAQGGATVDNKRAARNMVMRSNDTLVRCGLRKPTIIPQPDWMRTWWEVSS